VWARLKNSGKRHGREPRPGDILNRRHWREDGNAVFPYEIRLILNRGEWSFLNRPDSRWED